MFFFCSLYGDNFSSYKSASPQRISSGNQIFRRQYPSTFYTRDFHICRTELLSLQSLSQNSLYLLQSSYPFLNIQYSFKNTVQRQTVLLPPLCWNQTNQNSEDCYSTDSLSKHYLLQSWALTGGVPDSN